MARLGHGGGIHGATLGTPAPGHQMARYWAFFAQNLGKTTGWSVMGGLSEPPLTRAALAINHHDDIIADNEKKQTTWYCIHNEQLVFFIYGE
jgi:hypothetical protein